MTPPIHLCECGCGSPTPLATRSKAARGHVKGQPMPRLRGHGFQPSVEQRFWARVEKTDTCWLWIGKLQNAGYGVLSDRNVPLLAHRYAYTMLVGPIPEGLHIDHLCRVRNCVNPRHLEPVTPAENVRRGMSPGAVTARTNVCSVGHEGQYVTQPSGHRYCRPCRLAWGKARRGATA